METLYVNISARVSDRKYLRDAKRLGDATIEIELPRNVLNDLKDGNLLGGILQAAIANFDKQPEDTEEE